MIYFRSHKFRFFFYSPDQFAAVSLLFIPTPASSRRISRSPASSRKCVPLSTDYSTDTGPGTMGSMASIPFRYANSAPSPNQTPNYPTGMSPRPLVRTATPTGTFPLLV